MTVLLGAFHLPLHGYIAIIAVCVAARGDDGCVLEVRSRRPTCGGFIRAGREGARYGRRASRTISAMGSPVSPSPSITPARSASLRFWLAFHLPRMSATGISTPTIARICWAMKSSGASPTAQGFSRRASRSLVSCSICARSHSARLDHAGAPRACTIR